MARRASFEARVQARERLRMTGRAERLRVTIQRMAFVAQYD
jgi:hypothetical protein